MTTRLASLNIAPSCRPSLVVLAAGLGSRYRGTKQLEPLSEFGNVLIEYAVYDAILAGFGKVIFVTRRELRDEFEKIAAGFDNRIDVHFTYQDEYEHPGAQRVLRDKPWGTAHAVLSARHQVHEPFVVINADDYYGASAFGKADTFFAANDSRSNHFAMLGYALESVLSPHGGVSRGVCEIAADGSLRAIHEYHDIVENDGVISGKRGEDRVSLSGGQQISMNIWFLRPSIFTLLHADFNEFLAGYRHDPDAEFTLSDCLGRFVKKGKVSLECLPHGDAWFGVTYREDQPRAARAIRRLHENGIYPTPLWGDAIDG